jgi:hypothetical protein
MTDQSTKLNTKIHFLQSFLLLADLLVRHQVVTVVIPTFQKCVLPSSSVVKQSNKSRSADIVSHPRRPSELYLPLNGGQHVVFYLQTIEIKFKDNCKCVWRNVDELLLLQQWSASWLTAAWHRPATHPTLLTWYQPTFAILWSETRPRKISGCRRFEVTHDAPQSVGLPWTRGQLVT